MHPRSLVVDDVAGWAEALLAGRRRVLEVGCGRGELARRLGRAGWALTALDRRLRDAEPAPGVRWVEADFLSFDDEPYDALVFTATLHHLHPLERAIERSADLLAPGGLLLVDDFDLEAPDAETLRWYYEAQELLIAAGLYPPERLDGEPDGDPRERWRAGHAHEPPLSRGDEMLAAIGARFEPLSIERGPYLARYVISGLAADERGARIAGHLLAHERRRLAANALRAVGLRVVARRRTPPR
ncbi:MAG TPA: class I SAM-dependent methyltransferase [Polyangiaceae bacterium]|nr:class I SAM-dependent methyltransferase [Polyangiaceae bacterium]